MNEHVKIWTGKRAESLELIQKHLESKKEDWLKDICEFVLEWFNDKDYIQAQSSGSTGEPKKMRLLKADIEKSARMTAESLSLRANSKAFLCLPAQYIAGKMMIARALINDWQLWACNPKTELLSGGKDGYDFSAMIPLQVEKTLSSAQLIKSNIKKLIIGGAAISPSLNQKLQNCDVECFETFGMTETLSHIALRKVNSSEANDSFRLLKGMKAFSDHEQCLVVETPYSFGKVQSSDIVEFSSQEEFKWLGRKDDVVNSGGIKLHPALLDTKIQGLIPERYIFCGQKHGTLGERLVLVIEGEEYPKEKEEELKKHLSQKLDKYEVPKEIFYVKFLEETASGKIKRKLVQQ